MKRWWWLIAIATGVVFAVASARISGLPEVVRIALSVGALSLAGLVASVAFPEAAFEARLALRRRRRRGTAYFLLRDEARLRVFWRVAIDFDGAGWARRELETLRLIVRNVEAWRPLGPRLASRLAPAVHRVLADVLDRADDVAQCAQELRLDADAIDTVQRGIEDLARHLGEGRCVEGRPVPFDPRRIVLGTDLLLDGCARLLDAVRPSVACEPLTLLAPLAGTLSSKGRVVEIDEITVRELGRVGVRGRDLGEAIAALVGRGDPSRRRRVRIAGLDGERRVGLELSWLDENGVVAAVPTRPHDALRPLRCFGVSWEAEADRGRVTLSLPRYEPVTGPRPRRPGGGPLSSPSIRRRESGT